MNNYDLMWFFKGIIFGLMAIFVFAALVICQWVSTCERGLEYQLPVASLGFFLMGLTFLSFRHAFTKNTDKVKEKWI